MKSATDYVQFPQNLRKLKRFTSKSHISRRRNMNDGMAESVELTVIETSLEVDDQTYSFFIKILRRYLRIQIIISS